MNIFKRSSIRTKLKLAILTTTALSVALVFAGLFAYEQITYDDIFVNDIWTKADIISQNCDAALIFGNPTDATRVLHSLSTQNHVVAAAIYDQDGKVFAEYVREGGQGPIPPAPVREGFWYEGID